MEKKKSVKHVSEGGRVGKKKGYRRTSDRGPKLIKQSPLCPLHQSLVDRINSLLKRRLRARVALVISSGSCLLASSLEVEHHISSCVR
jgi:hypothetical protein